MPTANVPNRLTFENGRLYVGISNISAGVYTPPADYTAMVMCGPCREIEIDDPSQIQEQTAGGDLGAAQKLIRGGIWHIRIGAFIDTNSVNGDPRWGFPSPQSASFISGAAKRLTRIYVDFLIQNDPSGLQPTNLCRGTGILTGRLTGNAEQNVNMMREIDIVRWHPGALGFIEWADLYTGLF